MEAIEGIRIKEVLSSHAESTPSFKRSAEWENLFYSEAWWLDSESRGLDEDWFTWSVWGRGSVDLTGGVGNSIMPISVWWRIVSAWRVFSPTVLTSLLLASEHCLGVLHVTNIHGPNSWEARSLSVRINYFWGGCESVCGIATSCNIGWWTRQCSNLCLIQPHVKHGVGRFSYYMAWVKLPMLTWCHKGLSILGWS